MAVTNNLIKIIREGKAQLQVPKTVFYNPVQEFNRDLSVLVLKTFLSNDIWHHKSEEKHVKARGGLKILDALSASGLRSIRYAKELGQSGEIVKGIVANDIAETAVDLIKKNIELNNVSDKVSCSLSDAAMLLHMSSAKYEDRFHVIDLDPFGTGAQFFDAAVKSIGEAGLLMVTCTDTAVLCGNASESCFARYGSMSLRGEFCHDAALRIILRSIESHAAVYGRYIKPLLSISADFYVRLFMQVFTQQAETKKSASKLSQVYLCKRCKTHELLPLGSYHLKEDGKQAQSDNPTVKFKFNTSEVKVGDKCKICGGNYTIGGPIWSDPIHDAEFLNLLKKQLAKSETPEEFATFRRIQGIVHMCSEELSVPLLYSVDGISSTLKIKMPKTKELMSALVNAGYQVSFTHTNKCGLKTNAPSEVVWDIFCQAAEGQDSNRKDELAKKILDRKRERRYDFALNPAIEVESKKLSLLRFQMNPTKEWGPKPRPSAQTIDKSMLDKTNTDKDVQAAEATATITDGTKRMKSSE